MKPVQKQSVKKNYIYNLAYQMLAVIIPLMIQPYIARVLGAGEVGAFSYTTAITGYFALVGNLGIATYGQLRIAAYRNDRKRVSQIFWELALLRILLMGASSVAFLLFIRFLARPDYKVLYTVLIVQILASAIDIAWLLQGFEEFRKIVIRNTIIKIVSVILIFAFVKKQSDIYLYALIMNGSTLLGNASIWLFTPSLVDWVPLRRLNLKRHLRSCIVYFIPTIATTFYLSLDKQMIKWFTDTSLENGYYEFAQKIEQMAVTVVTSLSIVTMPRMANLFNMNALDRLRNRLEQTIRFILLLSIPMCLGLMSVTDYLVPLYLGPGYEKSATLLKIFSLLIVVVGLNNAVGKQVLMPVGRQKEYNMSVILGAIVNFTLNMILIPRLLSVGAVIGSVASETAILLAFIYFSKDYIRLGWILKASVRYLIAGAAMSAVIFISYNWLGISWKSLALQVAGGGIVYLLAVLLLRDAFALEMLAIVKRNLPFVKKRSGKGK